MMVTEWSGNIANGISKMKASPIVTEGEIFKWKVTNGRLSTIVAVASPTCASMDVQRLTHVVCCWGHGC